MKAEKISYYFHYSHINNEYWAKESQKKFNKFYS